MPHQQFPLNFSDRRSFFSRSRFINPSAQSFDFGLRRFFDFSRSFIAGMP
jgi:hypothetical protein